MNPPFEMKQTALWSRMLRLTAILALTVASAAQARLSVFEALDSASGHPTRFAQCPQFFVHGKPPAIPARPKLRELCYEAFAILHSGETKTPVYVAQRLNRQSIEDADEKRATKFFADARLAAHIEKILIIGSTWISQQIQETRDLHMRVPRLQTTAIGSQTSAR